MLTIPSIISSLHRDSERDFKAVETKHTSGTKVIGIIVFEECRGVSIPLYMKFTFVTSVTSVPIHEVTDRHNLHIKGCYWCLWFGDNETLPSIGVRETFHGPEVIITAKDVELSATWLVTRARCSRPQGMIGCRRRWISALLLDGRYVRTTPSTGVSHPNQTFQAIMKAIFPQSINGDLLNLVHLSSGFRMLDSVSPPRWR